jgi:diguanylate cyclase (GGDEF)-like protein/PAS domain S-box-containing protein
MTAIQMTAEIEDGGDMDKKKTHWINKYLTNNGRLNRSDILYRKVYLLNSILSIMFILCLVFVVIDIVIFKMFTAAMVNAAAVFLILLTLIYFKKTNKYNPAAYISIAILVICLASYFDITQNNHYAFFWLSILPPITYFLLERNAARIVLGLFGSYILYFILSNRTNWSPAEFDAQSLLNILGATLSLVLIIAYYEKSRNETWNELNKTIAQLVESKDDLNLILDTAAEAIYGIDLNGNCTFCNKSCIKMLGYRNQEELLGKNMHRQIHHTRRDGTPFPVDECSIFKAFIKGEGSHVEDEVFWRADGTSFDVEYYSYPQIKNGEITGAVITFMDISERKQKEAKIQYLNCYDTLTGLHNRRCFEDNRAKIDNPDNLPLSVIFADINGLKMTNDIFGHAAGDELIKKSSEILQQVCRQNDVVARVGGAEFIILLPNTTSENAEKILSRIKSGFSNARVEAIKCSIALGLDTKRSPDQLLDEIMANAENAMYKDKTMNRKSINKDIIDTIIETLHTKSPGEKQHSITVGDLCSEIGAALHLPETEINKLKRTGYLHDIGKIVLDENILTKAILSDEELEKMQQHAAVGYRILSLFDDTLDLAEYVYAHHERWDGTGYPRGLKGEQIHLLSRIISVVETYDRVLNRGALPLKERKREALDVIKSGSGVQFDPQIAELFIQIIEKSEEV